MQHTRYFQMHKLGLFFLLLLTPLSAKVDMQLWIYSNATHKLSETTQLGFEFEQRFRDNASNLYLYYLGILYGKNLTKWFEIRPGYRQFWI